MKFKSMTPVNNNYAVLATSKKHYHELCYDRKLDDRQFFWAVLDGGDESPDEIVLVELDETGSYEICERCLVIEKIDCPICGRKMFPKYDATHKPDSWQDCLGCGYRLDTSMDAEDTGDSHVQAMMKGGDVKW